MVEAAGVEEVQRLSVFPYESHANVLNDMRLTTAGRKSPCFPNGFPLRSLRENFHSASTDVPASSQSKLRPLLLPEVRSLERRGETVQANIEDR